MLNTFEFHCSSLCNVVFQVVTAERFYFKRPQASNYDAFPCSILSKGAAALIKQNSIQERSVLKLLACRLADRPAKGWIHVFYNSASWCCYFGFLLIWLSQSDHREISSFGFILMWFAVTFIDVAWNILFALGLNTAFVLWMTRSASLQCCHFSKRWIIIRLWERTGVEL